MKHFALTKFVHHTLVVKVLKQLAAQHGAIMRSAVEVVVHTMEATASRSTALVTSCNLGMAVHTTSINKERGHCSQTLALESSRQADMDATLHCNTLSLLPLLKVPSVFEGPSLPCSKHAVATKQQCGVTLDAPMFAN